MKSHYQKNVFLILIASFKHTRYKVLNEVIWSIANGFSFLIDLFSLKIEPECPTLRPLKTLFKWSVVKYCQNIHIVLADGVLVRILFI